MKKSPKQKAATEYGQLLFKIRGCIANLRTIQNELDLRLLDESTLQTSLEDEAKRQFEQKKESL